MALAAVTAMPHARAEAEGGAAEEARPPARATRARNGAARRQMRVIEMYDPGFRFSGPTRQDRAVERAASRAPDGIRTDEDQPPQSPFTPPPRTMPEEEPSSLWLDILYGRDADDADAQPVDDDPFQQLWGGAPTDLPVGQLFADPYEQMLQSYRELMQEEERRVQMQLLGESTEADPFTRLGEVDPRLGRENAAMSEYEPALANLLREATRGIDPNALEELSPQDLRALASEPFSPTIDLPGSRVEPEETAWDPTEWRSLLAGRSTDEPDRMVRDMAQEGSAPEMPIRIGRRGEEDRDFAGLGELRRQLMRVNTPDPSETALSFAPTPMGASAWEADPVAFLDTDDPFEAGDRNFGSARETLADRRLGGGTRMEGGGLDSSSVSLDERGGLFGRLGRGGDDTGGSLFGGSDQTRATDRRPSFDPRDTSDPFGQADRFGSDVDWGGLGR